MPRRSEAERKQRLGTKTRAREEKRRLRREAYEAAPRACEVCGNTIPFTLAIVGAKTCGPTCRDAHAKRRTYHKKKVRERRAVTLREYEELRPVCSECGVSICFDRWANTGAKTCSSTCGEARRKRLSTPLNANAEILTPIALGGGLGLSRHLRGQLSIAYAEAYLLRHGFVVFRETGLHGPFDLFAVDSGSKVPSLRVEVRSCERNPGGSPKKTLKNYHANQSDLILFVDERGGVDAFIPTWGQVPAEVLAGFSVDNQEDPPDPHTTPQGS